MNNIALTIKKTGGFIRMKMLKEAGFHTRTIAQAIENGIIEKIRPGLYRLPQTEPDAYSSHYLIHWAIPSAVIALHSAAVYHELVTANPAQIFIAVPQNKSKIRLEFPPIKVFYFPDTFYKIGLKTVKTRQGRFRVYSPEKTICDLFRYRKRLGESAPIEALRTYVSRKDRRITELLRIAEKCKVIRIIEPILKGLTA